MKQIKTKFYYNMIAIDTDNNEYLLESDDILYMDEDGELWLDLYGDLVRIIYMVPRKYAAKEKYNGYNL